MIVLDINKTNDSLLRKFTITKVLSVVGFLFSYQESYLFRD